MLKWKFLNIIVNFLKWNREKQIFFFYVFLSAQLKQFTEVLIKGNGFKPE